MTSSFSLPSLLMVTKTSLLRRSNKISAMSTKLRKCSIQFLILLTTKSLSQVSLQTKITTTIITTGPLQLLQAKG